MGSTCRRGKDWGGGILRHAVTSFKCDISVLTHSLWWQEFRIWCIVVLPVFPSTKSRRDDSSFLIGSIAGDAPWVSSWAWSSVLPCLLVMIYNASQWAGITCTVCVRCRHLHMCSIVASLYTPCQLKIYASGKWRLATFWSRFGYWIFRRNRSIRWLSCP